MTVEEFRSITDFERNLKPEDSILVRWTNNGNYFQAKAQVVRVNEMSIRVRLAEAIDGPLGGYPLGQEIVVPRFGDCRKWSANNRVVPQ